MTRVPLVVAALLAGTVAAGMVAGREVRADDQGAQAPTPRETTTPLLKAPLAGMPGKEVNILHFKASPGYVTPKHTHPGQLFVYVLSGTVTIDVDGKAPVKLGPGEVFQEPSGRAMKGWNSSATHDAELVVFQIGDKGVPLTVEAK